MVSVAKRNLLHDKIRFLITIVGIIFAVVLMTAQFGVYFGFMTGASLLIDRSGADIWITSRNTINFDSAKSFSESKINQVRKLSEVEWVERYIQTWGLMKLANGATERIQIMGFNPETGVGGPWKMKEGNILDVKTGISFIIDESSLKRLNNLKVGDHVELLNKKAKIVGISEGVRSFTTYPIAFTAYDTAKNYSSFIRPGQTTFLLVKLKPGVNADKVVNYLRATMSGVDVYTTKEFSNKTRLYWTVQTGLGLGIGIMVLIGFIVGTVIVGQTIYSSTLEHLREFGTLKAIGATNWDIYKIIFAQALINAFVGFLLSLVFIFLAQQLYEYFKVSMVVTPKILIAMLFVTVFMCLVSSFISIRKAAQIDPVIVFRA